MSAAQLRNEFFVPTNPEQTVHEFVSEVHQRYPWKQKSVLCMILSRNEKFMLTMVPRKLHNTDEFTQVPVQGRMKRRSVDPMTDASQVLNEKTGIVLCPEQLHYIGYGFTTNHTDKNPLGKCLHVVGGMVGEPRPLHANTYASAIDWVPVENIPAYAEQLMSPRKAWILAQAVLNAPAREKFFKARELQEAFF